jgi:ABC-type dipeptide/oligopeptide/nickel transport system permease component
MRIIERVPATLELVATAIAFALALALPAGIVAALRPRGWFDRTTTALAIAGISLPAFWFGLLLQIVFAIGLGWLPLFRPDDVRRRRAARPPAAPRAAGHGARRRPGSRVVALPARVDDRNARANHSSSRRGRAASRPAR